MIIKNIYLRIILLPFAFISWFIQWVVYSIMGMFGVIFGCMFIFGYIFFGDEIDWDMIFLMMISWWAWYPWLWWYRYFKFGTTVLQEAKDYLR